MDFLERSIEKSGLKSPIVIDGHSKMIIDGHHRVGAFKRMGLERIPAISVDYSDPRIVLKSKKDLTKGRVLEKAERGEKFPPKSTFHFIRLGKRLVHVSGIIDLTGRGA